ncbi:uncharacterized protein LOC123498462 [Portunus trituberculatus]|uniref:uncharacterized protein LOC123498462 n=1 Tax=Portunus trituberculatus TaxID=210409 RepID=UPI001E1CB0FC|nr:uncharacterized protein LOC123498462 [Portunus trituberculatus]
MKPDALTFLSVAALLGAAWGVSVGPVHLLNNQSYISFGLKPSPNRSVILCPYQLTAGEEVQRVYWEMWDDFEQVGTYEWRPATGGQAATGRLEGVVELNRDDGELELTKLRYDLAGDYLCGVDLTNGQSKNSSKEQVLIVDMSGSSSHSTYFDHCRAVNSFTSPATYPEPTLRAGLYLEGSETFYKEVSGKDWMKVVHPNGSITYSYDKVSFEIDKNSPLDIVFKLKMGFTKSDGTYISISSFSSSSPSWIEHGCPDVKERDHKGVRYFPSHNIVCRGGHKNTTKATVTCDSGYRSAGDVSIVVMRCNGATRTWQPEKGTTATFDDLKCVVDEGKDGNNENNNNKAVVSTGSPSLALLFASVFGVVLLFGSIHASQGILNAVTSETMQGPRNTRAERKCSGFSSTGSAKEVLVVAGEERNRTGQELRARQNYSYRTKHSVNSLSVTSALRMGLVHLPHDNRYINYTKGASPDNSLLECVHHLDEEEQVATVSWTLWDTMNTVGTFEWHSADPEAAVATGKLEGVVALGRDDGFLELLDLRYDLSGEYSCAVTLTNGKRVETAKWEVLIVESRSHLSILHRSLSECTYTTSYSTLAMFPKPSVRAGLYSESLGGFYKELPASQWRVEAYENGSFTHSYNQVSFELDAKTPMDVSFYVTVGIMKSDSNYIPVSSAMDKHIILHQLGCPEPKIEAYQQLEYHRDTITCRGEHKEAEATATCKEGFKADGDVEEVLIRCNEKTLTWVLEDGTPARREHLRCVIDGASSTASVSAVLLCVALVFQRLLLL